jgi:hypothetical protein
VMFEHSRWHLKCLTHLPNITLSRVLKPLLPDSNYNSNVPVSVSERMHYIPILQ